MNLEPPDSGRPRIHRRTRWVLLAGCVLVPTVFYPETNDVFALPKLLTLSVIVSTSIAVCAVSTVRQSTVTFTIEAVDVAVAMFVVLNLVALVLSVDRAQSMIGERLQYQGFVAIALYAGSFLVARTTVRDERALRLLFVAVSTGGVLVATYALIQRLGLDPIWDFLPNGRVFSSIGQPNALAAYLVLVIPLTVVLAIEKGGARLVWVAAIAIEVAALAFTFSRGGLLGFAASAAVFLFLYARRASRTARRIGALAAVAAVVVALPFAAFQPVRSSASNQWDRLVPGASDSGQLHVDLWQVGGHMAIDRPVFGSGQETFPEQFPIYRDDVLAPDRAEILRSYRPESPHNVYLATAIGAGLPALSAYVCVIVAFLMLTRKRTPAIMPIEAEHLVMALTAAVIGHLVTDFFMTAELTGSWLFWVLIGAGVGFTTSAASEHITPPGNSSAQ